MESLPVGNCGSPALDLESGKPDGWVKVRVRNFVYAWRQSKSCPRIQHLRKTHTTIFLDAGFFVSGFFATLSWFYAFTLIQSSMVRAIGQIELLFSYFSSKYLFREKTKSIELLGIFIFVSGVIIILLNR